MLCGFKTTYNPRFNRIILTANGRRTETEKLLFSCPRTKNKIVLNRNSDENRTQDNGRSSLKVLARVYSLELASLKVRHIGLLQVYQGHANLKWPPEMMAFIACVKKFRIQTGQIDVWIIQDRFRVQDVHRNCKEERKQQQKTNNTRPNKLNKTKHTNKIFFSGSYRDSCFWGHMIYNGQIDVLIII